MKVLIIQRIFPAYRKPIFNAIAKHINLLVLHGKSKSNIKQTTAEYTKCVFSFQYLRKETQVIMNIIIPFIKFKPDIVIHEFNPSILSLHISYILSKLLGVKFVVWGHGFNRKNKPIGKLSLSHRIRIFYIKMADAIIVYGQKAKSEL